MLLFTTENLDERFAKAIQVPGVEVIGLPTDTSYPSYDGRSTIGVRASMLYDPDGFLIELNQFIDPPDIR